MPAFGSDGLHWAQEIEDTVVLLLERGAVVETDMLANLKTVLPAEAANVLTSIIPETPHSRGDSSGGGMPSYDSLATADDYNYASGSAGMSNAPTMTYSGQDVQNSQLGENNMYNEAWVMA